MLRHCLTFLMAQLFTRNSRRKALLHMHGMITKQMGLIDFGKVSRGTGKTGPRFKSVAKCIYLLEWKNFEGMGKLCSRKVKKLAQKSQNLEQ